MSSRTDSRWNEYDGGAAMTPAEADRAAEGSPVDRRKRSGPVTVGDHLATEQGVYGVILVAGLVVASGSEPALTAFVTVTSTVVVFWAAHVYAGAVAHHGTVDGRLIRLRESLTIALQRSWGLLLSALVPAAILLFGVTHVVPDNVAQWAALWVCVAMLAVLGFVAFRRRGSGFAVCLLGATGTAAFGFVMVILKALLH